MKMNNQKEVDDLIEVICNNYSNEELEWADRASTICTTDSTTYARFQEQMGKCK